MKNKKYAIHLTSDHIIYLILACIAGLYLVVFKNKLTNWDDELYILYNPYLKTFSFENIAKIFSIYYGGNYHPLTLVSLAIDYHIAGVNPWPYQLTNLVLHLANTFLVYVVIRQILRLQSFKSQDILIISLVTAALFGIHTFQVESIAWVSERKNVLYTFFFLLSLVQYIRYLNNKSVTSYILSIFLFVLSLLSKGMAVPLSVCTVAIDYFAGRNIFSKKVILEKIPFLLLSLVFGIIAVFAQKASDAIAGNFHSDWLDRIAIASYGFIVYLIKLIYPFHLSAYYPPPVKPGEILPVEFYACIFFSLSIVFVIWKYFRHHKIVLFGTIFFVANISIVLQLLPVGTAIMADRYVYIPSIGFFFMVGYLLNHWLQTYHKFKSLIFALLILYGLVLGVKTYIRIGIWKDNMTLWNDALLNYPKNNFHGYLNRGNLYYDKGNYEEAILNFEEVLQINPHNSGALVGMGLIKRAGNDFQGAMNDFDSAILFQHSYEGYVNRGALKMVLHDFKGALDDLEIAYQKNTYKKDVYINKGYVFLQTGRYDEALQNFTTALQIDPGNYSAYLGMGRTRQALNDLQGALIDLNMALSLSQTSEAYVSRADLKMILKDYEGASADLDNALQIQPDRPDIYINKGMLEMSLGNIDNAFSAYNKAVELNRKNYQAYLYRALAKIEIKDFRGAVADLDTSLQLNKNATSFYYRGIANMRTGNKKAGCDDLKQSASLGNINAKAELQKNCK